MPTYVYKFIDTGETIEVQQAFSDDALTEAMHPTRNELLAVKKVFLPVGVTRRTPRRVRRRSWRCASVFKRSSSASTWKWMNL